MSALQQPDAAPPVMTQEDPADGLQAMLRAMRVAAENAAGTQSGAEARDYGQAALFFAQALVVLDPALSQGGTPLAHDLAIKAVDGETQKAVAAIQGETQVRVAHVTGEHSLRAAKEKAAAPTPSRQGPAASR